MDLKKSTTAVPESYLEHYGVKGMKWGVVRDKVNSIRNHPAAKLIQEHEDHAKTKKVRVRAKVAGVHTLSNKDLQEVITRMNLEVQYKNLKKVEHEQSLLGKGSRWAGNFLTRVSGDILTNVATSWFQRPGSSRQSARPHTTTAYLGDPRAIPGNYKKKAIGS